MIKSASTDGKSVDIDLTFLFKVFEESLLPAVLVGDSILFTLFANELNNFSLCYSSQWALQMIPVYSYACST